MIRKFLFTLVLLLTVLINLGSAKNSYQMGKSCLKKGEWENAVIHLKNALQDDPENPEILKDLGKAYYHQGDFNKSLEYLDQACRFDSLDDQTILYSGLNCENMEDYQKAREIYEKHLQLCKKSKITKKIKGRLTYLNRLEIEKQIRMAVKEESLYGVDPSQLSENTITVLYFESLGSSEKCDPLSKGIAELLTTDLSKVKKLRVIERIRLQVLLDEIGFGETGLVNSSTAPRVGRILRAEKVISGTLDEWEEKNLKMDSGILSLLTEQFDQVKGTSGELNQFFLLEKELVFRIIDHLSITLTKEERDEIKKVPTESMTAFLAYCQGLDCEDRGEYGKAVGHFADARSKDPNFIQAGEREQRARDLKEASMTIDQFEGTCISLVYEGAEDKGHRLQDSARDATGNFIPNDPNAPPEDPTKNPPPVQTTGTVIIKGEIK